MGGFVPVSIFYRITTLCVGKTLFKPSPPEVPARGWTSAQGHSTISSFQNYRSLMHSLMQLLRLPSRRLLPLLSSGQHPCWRRGKTLARSPEVFMLLQTAVPTWMLASTVHASNRLQCTPACPKASTVRTLHALHSNNMRKHMLPTTLPRR